MKPLHLFITGATGLIGSALVDFFLAKNFSITALSRNLEKARQRFPTIHWMKEIPQNFETFDAVINLAGEPIFAKCWTPSQKKILWQSRVVLTRQLVKKINDCNNPPRFFSASATGFYGDRGALFLTEMETKGEGFTAELCQSWEAEALKANTETTILRFGQVMSPKGGALQKMLPIFQGGCGGRLGSGEQFVSWISLEDCIRAIDFLIQKKMTGVINLTSPKPIQQKAFASQLNVLLGKRNFFPAPRIGLFFTFGERSTLLLHSQRAVPESLLTAGFTFQHATFADYLKSQATYLNLR